MGKQLKTLKLIKLIMNWLLWGMNSTLMWQQYNPCFKVLSPILKRDKIITRSKHHDRRVVIICLILCLNYVHLVDTLTIILNPQMIHVCSIEDISRKYVIWLATGAPTVKEYLLAVKCGRNIEPHSVIVVMSSWIANMTTLLASDWILIREFPVLQDLEISAN